MKIKELIIVEGKTDIQKLKKIFGDEIQTLETKGLAISDSTLKLISLANDNQGVIIFTDPDGPGKKIREKINNYLIGEVKNAFISKKDVLSDKKIGIAEADEQAIKNALNDIITFSDDSYSMTWSEYLENDFFLPINRRKIAEHFNWDSKISSKTLFKWINWSNIGIDEIKEILVK